MTVNISWLWYIRHYIYTLSDANDAGDAAAADDDNDDVM